MATTEAVSAGSRFCRDCGGTVTTKDSFAWCANKVPKARCRTLPAATRLFCEHCGAENPGPGICPKCRTKPSRP